MSHRNRPRRVALMRASFVAFAAVLAGAIALHPMTGTRPPGARVLGPSEPHKRIDVSLILRLPRARALSRFLAGSEVPSRRSYRAASVFFSASSVVCANASAVCTMSSWALTSSSRALRASSNSNRQ